ncbi:hypothetical protein ACPRNU_20125 [Chromobacterium vaccinii]|uniref:hypothetical protein n=1 Tax=Chromobacterium TaxID=535 RepID=UPI0018F24CE3|nr:hypothetical protein [Chromobacterium sp. ATCC 53434]
MIVYSYLGLCLVVAYMGRRTRLGFLRTMLFSIFMTPVLMMIYLLIAYSTDERR